MTILINTFVALWMCAPYHVFHWYISTLNKVIYQNQLPTDNEEVVEVEKMTRGCLSCRASFIGGWGKLIKSAVACFTITQQKSVDLSSKHLITGRDEHKKLNQSRTIVFQSTNKVVKLNEDEIRLGRFREGYHTPCLLNYVAIKILVRRNLTLTRLCADLFCLRYWEREWQKKKKELFFLFYQI